MDLHSQRWNQRAFRRAVIDMHIPDWDEQFLCCFDADQYVARLVEARAQSVVAYAQSHAGLFNYPTRVGQQHRGLQGRNLLQEIIARCRSRRIAVVAYVSLIFDRWAADTHPEWRMVNVEDKPHGEGGRHGLLCPNSPYREYVRAFTEELCTDFEFEGVRFDMTFWPAVCYCRHCRARFADEVGGELPTTVDWLDPHWVAFQRRREAWLAEFAGVATGAVRRLRPGVTVEHQSSTYPLDWMFGAAAPLAAQNDFLQGDFYGDALQGSFVRKLLEDLSPSRPIGFETSAAVDLRNHTAIKPAPLLEAKAAAAIADHAAFIFIDAIDPIGTVNPLPHRRMGKIFSELEPLHAHLGGQRVRDIAVYYSPESKFNFAGNGRKVAEADRSDAHTESAVAVCRVLGEHHLPYGVVTKGSLRRLDGVRVLVLPNVCMMDEGEVAAIRQWVEAGGALYASGWTSLVDKQGHQHPDFMLSGVFGVSLRRPDWQGHEHFLAPTAAGRIFFGEFTAQYPAFATGIGLEVAAHAGAEVLATTTLPWPAPDPSRFSSIHSNPPWAATANPEVVHHRCGRGQVIYCSSPLEKVVGLGDTLASLLRRLCPAPTVEAAAPACVELTLFHQPVRGRYVLSLVNFQKELPNIPVEGIEVRLRLPQLLKKAVLLPGGQQVPHRVEGEVARLLVPRLETLVVLALEVASV